MKCGAEALIRSERPKGQSLETKHCNTEMQANQLLYQKKKETISKP